MVATPALLIAAPVSGQSCENIAFRMCGGDEVARLPPAVVFGVPPRLTFAPMLAGKTIAVARNAAFCLLYPANLECLAAMGARLAFFSPLADEALPECDAVWLPDGYPELHGTAIAANHGMHAHGEETRRSGRAFRRPS